MSGRSYASEDDIAPYGTGEKGAGRRNQYFVPKDGISREVIQADICKYLDHDAIVRPGEHNGQNGYLIYAYRNLTSAMVQDIKADSARWEKERKEKPHKRTRGEQDAYVDSNTHHRRQQLTIAETPPPISDYVHGRPPPSDFSRQGQPSPYEDPNYTMQPANPSLYTSQSSNYPPSYPSTPAHMPLQQPQYNIYGYAPEPAYGRAAPPTQNPISRPYPPAQTAPPLSSRDPRDSRAPPARDPRYDYVDQREPPRGDPRSDPRAYAEPPRQAYDSRPDPRQYADPRTSAQTPYVEPRYQDPRYQRR